jgi:hypothetical protein
MNRSFGLLVLLATAAFAYADAVDDVKNSTKKLSEKGNYSWRTTTDLGNTGGNFRPGPTEGKTEREVGTYLSLTRGDNTTEAVLKDKKGALKTEDSWKSLSELTADDGGSPNRGRFIARILENFKAPAEEAEDLASKTKNLKKMGEAYSGDLTDEGAKQFLVRFRPPGNSEGPSNAKGSAKFWIKDGILSKYEYHVKGTVNFNGQERDVDRTTTVEIKDVGSTKVKIPEEASKKLS